ncbi:MAG: hypothetical protein AAF907_05585 [Planctomycetota bacterium]
MFQIELESREASPGGKIRGEAIYSPEKETNPKSIQIEVGWETRGRGNKDSQAILRADREIGPVAAGERVVIPFEATLPEGVVRSFAGELLELVWAVRGRVDVPWAIDEKAETVFQVVADDVRTGSPRDGIGETDGM